MVWRLPSGIDPNDEDAVSDCDLTMASTNSDNEILDASRIVWACRMTAPGRGAVATVLVSGSLESNDSIRTQLDSLFTAANGRLFSSLPLRKIAFGKWGHDHPEELVICRTSEIDFEIHCHGGEAAVRRIQHDLRRAGCRVARWTTMMTARGQGFDAECRAVLSRASTWKTTQEILKQLDGLLRQSFTKLAELAQSDEVQFREKLDQLLAWESFGRHLTVPWHVVLTGRPNVGKSSLINALLGYERAIVFDQPGTTRDVVTGETAFEGWPFLLADTAGIRQSDSRLETAGIQLAQQRLQVADVRILLIDLSQPATAEDQSLMSQWPNAIVVAHKSDLPKCWSGSLPDSAIIVSSVTGQGLAELQQRLVASVVPRIPEAGTPVPLTERQFELLRAVRMNADRDERQRILNQLLVPIFNPAND